MLHFSSLYIGFICLLSMSKIPSTLLGCCAFIRYIGAYYSLFLLSLFCSGSSAPQWKQRRLCQPPTITCASAPGTSLDTESRPKILKALACYIAYGLTCYFMTSSVPSFPSTPRASILSTKQPALPCFLYNLWALWTAVNFIIFMGSHGSCPAALSRMRRLHSADGLLDFQSILLQYYWDGQNFILSHGFLESFSSPAKVKDAFLAPSKYTKCSLF